MWRSFLIVLVAEGCGGRSHAGADAGPPRDSALACFDADGDGFGWGEGCLGPDCRDDDSTVHDCDCQAVPTNAGCPCSVGEPARPCYEAPDGTADVGPCRKGTRECGGDRWSACEGQVLPQDERCDAEDNDCDGVTDDGVLSECGNCDQGCSLDRFGEGGEPFAVLDPALRTDDEGALTLTDGSLVGQLTLRFDATENPECPNIHGPIDAGADVPEGASILFEVREGYSPVEIDAAEWHTVLVLPGGDTPADMPTARDHPILVDLRITLVAAPDSALPVLHWLTVASRYVSCTLE